MVEFEIGVRSVARLVREVGQGAPLPAVDRALEAEPGDDVGRVAVAAGLVVGVVHLHRAHRAQAAEVERERLPGGVVRGDPERARILVGHFGRRMLRPLRRGLRGLAVRQQHPAGERALAFMQRMIGHALRKVAETGVDPHLAVRVEAGGEQVDAPLEPPVQAHPHGAAVPPVAMRVLESGTVAGADGEAAGLVADRIVRRIGERSERLAADVHAGGVHVVFGTGRAVLQVVAVAVPVHPGALDVGLDAAVGMVLAEALPAVRGRIGLEQGDRLGDEAHPLAFAFVGVVERQVDLRAVQRKDVG